jgi:hypothetical protein
MNHAPKMCQKKNDTEVCHYKSPWFLLVVGNLTKLPAAEINTLN